MSGLLPVAVPGWLLPVAVAVVVLLVVVAGARRLLLVRACRERVGLRMVPSERTEVTVEDVVRMGHLMSRVRPSVSLVPRRAYAVRVLLRNVEGSLLAYEVHGPARAAGLLRSAGFPGTEMVLVEAVPVEPVPGGARWGRFGTEPAAPTAAAAGEDPPPETGAGWLS